MLVSTILKGQTLAEWFDQKATDLKYLAAQIEALKTYIGYAEKGYDIAKNGLTLISQIKNGEFNLHQVFFGSMKLVSSKVSGYSKTGDILSLQSAINSIVQQIRNATNMNPNEMSYINSVCDHLLSESLENTATVLDVTTDDVFTMNDDERITMIDKLWKDTKDEFSFAQKFLNDVKLLSTSRLFESADIQTLKNLY